MGKRLYFMRFIDGAEHKTEAHGIVDAMVKVGRSIGAIRTLDSYSFDPEPSQEREDRASE